MESRIREFLEKEIGEQVVRVFSRRGTSANLIESFVIETTSEVSGDVLLDLLKRYYQDAEVVVRGQNFHWVKRPGKRTLLINIHNLSGEQNGAFFMLRKGDLPQNPFPKPGLTNIAQEVRK